ncbi:MAG: TRAP ABC transporter substrate-binding protein [Rhodospirillales bacterium 70-18]|nr:MAG: TRAP ABC transporter substrate-binding protein [Rhodospirillales bacterium 70-18]
MSLLLLLGLASLSPARAQVAPPDTTGSASARVAQANAGTVGVISGGVAGTYIRIAADLASVLDDGTSLRVLPLVGKGSVQNISDILFLRGIDVGIVQSDALTYVRRRQLFPGADQAIQYIAKLYEEEVHILARRDITRLQDLSGQTVNVDVVGSGTAMTTQLLFESLGIKAQLAHDDQDSALAKLKEGKIAALIYVVGKPARLFSGLDSSSGLHFLPIPLNDVLAQTYIPSKLGHDAYPDLVPADGSVDTIAVGAVMAAYAWAPNTDRYKRVAHFVDEFFAKFPKFLEPGRHPKWKEVNLAAQVPGWTRFPEAQEAMRRMAVSSTDTPLQRDFTTFLTSLGSNGGGLTTAQKEALFQQFLLWQARHQASR